MISYIQLWRQVPRLRLVLLVLKLKYDETPMRVWVAAASDGQHRLLSRRDPQEAATAAKIMQVEHAQGVLLQNMEDKSYVYCCTPYASLRSR